MYDPEFVWIKLITGAIMLVFISCDPLLNELNLYLVQIFMLIISKIKNICVVLHQVLFCLSVNLVKIVKQSDQMIIACMLNKNNGMCWLLLWIKKWKFCYEEICFWLGYYTVVTHLKSIVQCLGISVFCLLSKLTSTKLNTEHSDKFAGRNC